MAFPQEHENTKQQKVFFFVVSCFRGFVIVRVYETRSSYSYHGEHGGHGGSIGSDKCSLGVLRVHRGGELVCRRRVDLRRRDDIPHEIFTAADRAARTRRDRRAAVSRRDAARVLAAWPGGRQVR